MEQDQTPAPEAVTEETKTELAPGDVVVETPIEVAIDEKPPLAVDGDVVSRMVERDINIPLTDEVIAKLAEKAAALDKEKSDLEAAKKKSNAEFSEQINKKDAEISSILKQIREGEVCELRMVREVRDYNAASVSLYVNDQLVEERAMEGDELQKDLFLRNGKDEKAPTDSEIQQKLQAEADAFQGKEEDKALPVSEAPLDPAADLRNVMREETSRHTKHSSVDGPTS